MEKGSTGRVLVFSSNSKFVISLCEMLSKTEYTFQGYHSWDDALEGLKAKKFDVFLADIEIPELDGVALLKVAMKIDPCPIGIIITGQNEFSLPVEAMRIGIFDYITKPFKLELLLSKISRGIEVSRLRSAYDVYRTVFDNAVEGCYLMDAERKFVAVNRALAELLGYATPDDLMWHITDVERQLYVDPAYHMVLNRLVMERSTISDFESQAFRRDKSVIWISENIHVIYDQYGNIQFYRGTITDITGKKQSVHALRENMMHFQFMIEKAERDKDALQEIIEEMCHSYTELEAFFINFVSTMVNVIDGKSPWMKGHSVRVASYATKIGKEIGLDNEELKKLRLASLLHDIGKIHCNGLLDKPEKLSKEEFEEIKKLPVHGANILRKVRQMKDLIPIVKHHHERIDGRGYPDGLRGDDIPFIARILHVADSYDSMTANRPYREAPGREYAFEELKRNNNTQFDSRVTDAALKVL